MLPAIMLTFIVLLMVIFIVLSFLQKKKDPSIEDHILSDEELQKIKKKVE